MQPIFYSKHFANKAGFEAIEDRAIGTWGPIVNTAGVLVPDKKSRAKLSAVLVYRKYVSDFAPVLAINSEYEHTTNSEEWSTYAKGHARYVSATLSGPIFWMQNPRYQLTVRVAVSNRIWQHQFPNVGTTYYREDDFLDQLLATHATDADGFADGLAHLDADGKRAAQPNMIAYNDLREVDYQNLVNDIEAYG